MGFSTPASDRLSGPPRQTADQIVVGQSQTNGPRPDHTAGWIMSVRLSLHQRAALISGDLTPGTAEFVSGLETALAYQTRAGRPGEVIKAFLRFQSRSTFRLSLSRERDSQNKFTAELWPHLKDLRTLKHSYFTHLKRKPAGMDVMRQISDTSWFTAHV